MTGSDVYDGDWRLLSYDEMTGVKSWYLDVGSHFVIRTDTPIDELLEENREALNASAGKRFGDGQVVASIPLDIYYKELAEAQRQGDQNYIRKYLNSSDNNKFRRFGGRI